MCEPIAHSPSEALAIERELKPSSEPTKELDVQYLLQGFDALADSTLCDMQFRGRFREVQAAGAGLKGAQRVERR